MNEPELRLGRREGIVPESPTGCPKWGWAETHESPCASTWVPTCTHCPFQPHEQPWSCCGWSGGAGVWWEAAAQPGLGELTQAEAFCGCISHLGNPSFRRQPLINP